MAGSQRRWVALEFGSDRLFTNRLRGLSACRFQITADLYLLPNQFVDLATLNDISHYTAGQCFYYPNFDAAQHGVKFTKARSTAMKEHFVVD